MLLKGLCCYGWAHLDLSWLGIGLTRFALSYAEGGLSSPPKKHRAGRAASKARCVTRELYEDEKVSLVQHPT